ncbi:MAG: hypothetical protein IPN83_10555 [Holophagales bacterium]|nr:hypothetical protein [Holophagales bacterium]
MRRLAVLALTLLPGAASLSCKVYLPFRFQLTPRLAEEATRLHGSAAGPIALRWEPSGFPQRVDVQGASGFIGGASRTRIPMGVSISTKVHDFLHAAVGVEEGAPRTVTIRVVEAKTSFEYGGRKRAGIDRARCTLKVEVDDGKARWSEAYFASDEPGGDPPTQTSVLDGVYDEVSAALARDVVRRLAATPKAP